MKYRIEHETGKTIRIRCFDGLSPVRLSSGQVSKLRAAFGKKDGIEKLTVYPAAGGLRLRYSCSREKVTGMLDSFSFDTFLPEISENENYITQAEIERRKLDPEIKKKMEREIIVESAADLFLPPHLQLAYHAYQLLKLAKA